MKIELRIHTSQLASKDALIISNIEALTKLNEETLYKLENELKDILTIIKTYSHIGK